tara:strand:+ start:24966 stop:25385 length:420 start_codon:yes stop_codon:yes gene_type:complete
MNIEEIKPELLKNRFRYLYDLRDLFQMQSYMKKDGSKRYIRITAKGNDFPLFDYNVGLYSVEIWPCYCCDTGGYSARLYIGNADDGEWEADGKIFDNIEDCQKVVDKIAEEIIKDMHIILPEEELNLALRPYGMYGGIG